MLLVVINATSYGQNTLVGDMKLNVARLVGVVGGVASLPKLNDCIFLSTGISFWASSLNGRKKTWYYTTDGNKKKCILT